MKKKILHIVEAFGGGIFSFLVDLINNTSNEYEIVVAYAMRKQTPENFTKQFPENVKFIRVENFVRNISFKNDIKAFFEIKKIIKEEKPQIIHLHSSKAGFLGRMATIFKKINVLYNPHGFSFLMQDCSRKKQFFYWLVEKIGTIKNAIIISCSQGEYKEALKLTSNAILINNGINIEELDLITQKFIKKEINFSKLTFCTSGRIGAQKNPKMFNEIAKCFPDNKFTWIGDGELKKELTSTNIEITGWKKREEVIEIVNNHDVFLLTSLWEGMPISLLEAMYLNKLCLVTNVIGNNDLIVDLKNGYIIKDLNAIKEFICNITEVDYFKLSNQARNDLINKYNLNIMIEKYLEVYNK